MFRRRFWFSCWFRFNRGLWLGALCLWFFIWLLLKGSFLLFFLFLPHLLLFSLLERLLRFLFFRLIFSLLGLWLLLRFGWHFGLLLWCLGSLAPVLGLSLGLALGLTFGMILGFAFLIVVGSSLKPFSIIRELSRYPWEYVFVEILLYEAFKFSIWLVSVQVTQLSLSFLHRHQYACSLKLSLSWLVAAFSFLFAGT